MFLTESKALVSDTRPLKLPSAGQEIPLDIFQTILAFLEPKEMVRILRVSKSFQRGAYVAFINETNHTISNLFQNTNPTILDQVNLNSSKDMKALPKYLQRFAK